jgi:hypothetical protein
VARNPGAAGAARLVRLRTPGSFRGRLEAAFADVRVAGPPGAPVGFCALKGDELHQIFLAPEARGSGAAAAPIADAEARLARRGVRDGMAHVCDRQRPRGAVLREERLAPGRHGRRPGRHLERPAPDGGVALREAARARREYDLRSNGLRPRSASDTASSGASSGARRRPQALFLAELQPRGPICRNIRVVSVLASIAQASRGGNRVIPRSEPLAGA